MHFDEEKFDLIRKQKFSTLIWSPQERIFRSYLAKKNEIPSSLKMPFSGAIELKLKLSVFGTYLQSFNYQQTQDKYFNDNKWEITKWNLKEFDELELEKFNDDNNIFDECIPLLKQAVKDADIIDWEYLYQRTFNLKLNNCHISFVDRSLRNFRNLRKLVLCDNFLNDIDGSCLPRKLEFLELNVNNIARLDHLTYKPPKSLQYLGIGQNKLTNSSNLHLLGVDKSFSNLKMLDIGSCDLYKLEDVLHSLENLQNLESLILEGNPCSVVISYKFVVLKYLPNLLFLDGVEILKDDREINENYLENIESAEIVLYCTKITGLPPTPKDKNVKQTIHLEFTLPLLEDIKLQLENEEKTANKTKDIIKNKKDITLKQEKGGKPGKGSPYTKPTEEIDINHFRFTTERKNWSKNLEYSPVIIKSPLNSLYDIRDTFRSSINVRLVYLKTSILKKEKTDKKKNEKKTKGKDTETEKKYSPPTEPKEVILKRVTLANFNCDLNDLKWNKESMNFIWSDQFKENPEKAKTVDAYLHELAETKKLAEEKAEAEKETKKLQASKGKKEEKGSKEKSQTNKKTKSEKKGKDKNTLACYVGFGLRRF